MSFEWYGRAVRTEPPLARTASDRPALIAEETVTYGQLERDIETWRGELERRGIGGGTAVLLQAVPSVTYLALLYALWRRGAGVMLADPRLRDSETEELIERFRPDYVLRGRSKPAAFVTFRSADDIGIEPLRPGRAPDGPQPRGFALMQFTSGTTGRPKAVVRTGPSLLAEIGRVGGIAGGIGPQDTVAVLASLHHSFGLIGGVMTSLACGASVLVPPSVQASVILERLSAAEATTLLGVPLHFELLAGMGGGGRGRLRAAVCGGEPLDASVASRFAERFGVSVGQAYGTTETGMLAADWTGERPGTVGRSLDGIECATPGGELLVRLPQSPYADDAGSERFKDGWLHTRDAAEIEPDSGLVSLHGRLDSIRIIGGLKVDALETERCLGGHPEVEEARVVFTDGSRMEAYLAGKPGMDLADVLQWCADRLAAYKIPRAFYRVPALPRTPNGKPVRDPAALAACAGTPGTDE